MISSIFPRSDGGSPKVAHSTHLPCRLLFINLHYNEVLKRICDAPNPGVPLTTRQPAEFLWISGDPIPHCCVPFIRIHILKKNQSEPPLFGELYPSYNLNNSIIIVTPQIFGGHFFFFFFFHTRVQCISLLHTQNI